KYPANYPQPSNWGFFVPLLSGLKLFLAPKGRKIIAQGIALGKHDHEKPVQLRSIFTGKTIHGPDLSMRFH
ncbi:MAG: hypothetical protein JSV24_08025, partial [Bacteroidales bacterium]